MCYLVLEPLTLVACCRSENITERDEGALGNFPWCSKSNLFITQRQTGERVENLPRSTSCFQTTQVFLTGFLCSRIGTQAEGLFSSVIALGLMGTIPRKLQTQKLKTPLYDQRQLHYHNWLHTQ